MTNNFENKDPKKEANPATLEQMVTDLSTDEVKIPTDGYVPDHVKKDVNNRIWEKLQNEEHPPEIERAD
jgi:hypothetical protein